VRTLRRLDSKVRRLVLPGRAPAELERLSAASPAEHAMTDFLRDAPFVTRSNRLVGEALQDMIACGVRALLVVGDEAVTGLVTAADLLGERAVISVHDAPGAGLHGRHADVEVSDVMTPVHELRILPAATLRSMTVGDLERLFLDEPVTHVLVVDTATSNAEKEIRGILSRSRLERHLGRPLGAA